MEADELITVLPIHYSNKLLPNVLIHQFPLMTRALQLPPSSILSGKKITARIKHNARRLEIHVPADTRSDVWNSERAKELGSALMEDDREKNQEKSKAKDGETPRLSEVRLRSEEIHQRGSHLLGIVRDGKLHLHPINETHQLRPTLTYLDVLSRKVGRSRGESGSDSDGGPPDPDEPNAVSKKEKKEGEVKEVQVTTRKSDDKGGPAPQGGLSSVRREMLHLIRLEEDEDWEDLEFCDVTTTQSEDVFKDVFSCKDDVLHCKSNMTAYLRDIQGL